MLRIAQRTAWPKWSSQRRLRRSGSPPGMEPPPPPGPPNFRRAVASEASGRDKLARPMPGFRHACGIVEDALAGPSRRDLTEENSLSRLRKALRSHALAPFVPDVDHRTRSDGFHVLHDWDGKADHVNPEIIPVDVLDYIVLQFGDEGAFRKTTIGVLLDYYFLHVLSLLSLRIWDDGDPDANLDRLDGLLGLLQGSGGSSQRFTASAGTLLLLAT